MTEPETVHLIQRYFPTWDWHVILVDPANGIGQTHILVAARVIGETTHYGEIWYWTHLEYAKQFPFGDYYTYIEEQARTAKNALQEHLAGLEDEVA